MKLRFTLAGLFLGAWFSCQCGPTENDPCAGVTCGPGLSCDPQTGRCVVAGAGGSGGSGAGGGATGGGGGGTAPDAGTCTATCSGTTPICDPATNTCRICTETSGCDGTTPICQTISNGGLGKCVTCTVTAGCSGLTPACDPTVYPNGACVQCVSPDDCPVSGSLCDLNTHTCVPANTGGGTGGGAGGGTGGGGGGSSGPPVFDDAGMTARCLPFDAGTTACTTECPKGYECISNQCKLRGSSGPVQVTLRFNQPEDLDLHLVEPLPDGGTCEIYYAAPGVNPNAPPIPIPLPIPIPNCGAKGWLDVDSNAACDIDNINVENIIYSPGVSPTRGTYIARVVYYQHCSASGPIPYEVEVRANGVTRWYCGQFQPGDANGGNQGAGVTVSTFTLP